ncbi:amino acid permease [Methanothermobacter sp.]|uniref:amino acid permease n=1 Tax=Methanothermobacter sp. TaxID=1884223 RepID=UPI003C7664AB
MKPQLRRELSLFDTVNLVIGTIVGADIYIVAAYGAGSLGPASILAWFLAGLMAVMIALVFSEASGILPVTGGPYAYAGEALGRFAGFLTGWSLWISSWIAIAVFPIAFVYYLEYFIPLNSIWEAVIKVLFIVSLTLINIAGVGRAGKVNDVLTVLKVAPVLLLAILGAVYLALHPTTLSGNYTPLAPMGLGALGGVTVLVFWAYVGFELVTVPADEVKNPERNIPLAITLGMVFVMLFYLLTNAVILGLVPWRVLAASTAPLTVAGYSLMGGLGALILTSGAVFSIAGSEEAGMLTTARLLFAMSRDGFLPRALSRVHGRFGTPHVSILIQNLTALAAALTGTAAGLIELSVLTLLLPYATTCVSLGILRRREGAAVPVKSVLGVLICIYLLLNTTAGTLIAGVLLITGGVPLYLIFRWRNSKNNKGCRK